MRRRKEFTTLCLVWYKATYFGHLVRIELTMIYQTRLVTITPHEVPKEFNTVYSLLHQGALMRRSNRAVSNNDYRE